MSCDAMCASFSFWVQDVSCPLRTVHERLARRKGRKEREFRGDGGHSAPPALLVDGGFARLPAACPTAAVHLPPGRLLSASVALGGRDKGGTMHAPSAISAALATLAVALQVGQAAAGPANAPT